MNTSVDLAPLIAAQLRASPGQTAREVAAKLRVDKKDVNSLLYGRLRGQFQQDKGYRWYPADSMPKAEAPTQVDQVANTPLSRLCRYYLACLGQDAQDDLSVFASGRHGLDYVSLDELPDSDDLDEIFKREDARTLLNKMRRDRSRLALYLGYPVFMNKVRARSGWEGFFVVPLMLRQLEFDQRDFSSAPRISDSYPLINVTALHGMKLDMSGDVMHELVQLEADLGLDLPPDEVPDLDEVVVRLRELRSEWPWREDVNPFALITTPHPSEIVEPGIYNRAVLFVAARSPYTVGLETELQKLTKLEESGYADTVLGAWINGKSSVKAGQASDEELLEVLPMNVEQRQAVQRALTQPMTAITGPPGTGKSQVVTNLLINAAWRGQRVLFASKNHKAVDVVDVRINNLGSRPILLRLGPSEHQARLADYLDELLSAKAGPEEEANYRELRAVHDKLRSGAKQIQTQQDQLIERRNQADSLEQSTEGLRQELKEHVFSRSRLVDIAALNAALDPLLNAIARANPEAQPWPARVAWRAIKKQRYRQLELAAQGAREAVGQIGLKINAAAPTDATIRGWIAISEILRRRIDAVTKANAYFGVLAEIGRLPSLERLAEELAGIFVEIAGNSGELWKSWLRLQPNRMSASERKDLSKYVTLMRMVNSGKQTDRKVWAQFYQTMSKVAQLLPCWAVTSLSAKGKIPFDAGLFDLVIFDEASQCDIASAIPLLYRAKRAVVIGDPMQLSHICGINEHQDQQLMIRHEVLENHAHWAYSHQSLYGLARSNCGPDDIVNLRDHHRSHKDIIEFSNRQFYGGTLRVATNYDKLKRPRRDGPALRWKHAQGHAEQPASGSGAINKPEAEAVIGELRQLVLEQGYSGSLGVVSPFRAQANYIRELTVRDDRLAERLSRQDFLVDTVHKFQGDERDMIIFSPVVAAGISKGSTGFLRSNGNLFNVAITRARAALLVVGDKVAASNCGVDYLEQFVRYCDEITQQKQRESEAASRDIGPEYPAVADPSKVSEWEKVLYRALYKAGLRPLPQYVVDQYALDLALIVGDRRLDIEVDGERYHRSWNGELARRDQIRNQRMFELGWDVKRFWVYQVRDELDSCVAWVKRWADSDVKESATRGDALR